MTIERMDATFEQLKWDEDATLSRDFVRSAMQADDLEVLGTLYRFVSEERNAARIVPPAERGELVAFATRYLDRCLREDPLGDDFLAQRSTTRQGAGWEFVRWYVRLLKALPPEADALTKLRDMLALAYRQGDAGLRHAIVGSALIHLFASTAVRRTFDAWKNDPDLREAYVAALPFRSRRTGLRARAARTALAQPLTSTSRTAIRT